jgi:ribulose-phosphate 3-epimerase
MKLAPSILAADLADLAGALRVCEQGGAEMVHVDVMDGHFVPNLTFGIPVVAALDRRTDLPLDVHLMVSNPDRLLDDYLAAGADRVAVHLEVAIHLDRPPRPHPRAGARPGWRSTRRPRWSCWRTPSRAGLRAPDVGQPGLRRAGLPPPRARQGEAAGAADRTPGAAVEIAMDGGLDAETTPRAVAAGVETCVVGSAIFAREDPLAAMAEIRARAEGGKV